MATITSAGIGSGLDIEGLVTKLVSAEGAPATARLTKKEATLQADLSAVGSLKSALSDFQTAVTSLGDATSLLGRTATVSNTDVFSASAVSTAVPGSYSVEVVQLAQSAKLSKGFTSPTEVVGTGTLTLSQGSKSFSITVDDTNKTLTGIRDAINAAKDNPGITASIVSVDSGAQLVLTSNQIGASNAITVTTVDADGNNTDNNNLSRLATANLTTVQAAQDAKIKVDGQTATRSSNTITDVINGVTLTLTAQSASGSPETLTVGMDKSGVSSKLKGFVTAYNALVDTMAKLSSYDPQTKVAGPLLGDSTLYGVQSQVRQVISNAVPGLSSYSSLAQIGVTTDAGNHLVVDGAKLDAAMTSNFSAVSQLFASDQGVAKKLQGILNGYLSTTGVFSTKTDSINAQIKDATDQQDRLSRHLADLETRYRAQFTALDTLMGQMQTTSTYLTQQLASLPGFVTKK